MRRYERQQRVQYLQIEVEAKCDRCGIDEANAEFGRLVPVAIEVNWGEEYGCRDEYDYCDNCLIAIADTLAAAGSRSSLVNDPPIMLPCPACGTEHEPPLHEDLGGYL